MSGIVRLILQGFFALFFSQFFRRTKINNVKTINNVMITGQLLGKMGYPFKGYLFKKGFRYLFSGKNFEFGGID